MFIGESSKDSSINPTSLTDLKKKKELIDFKPESLLLMYHWLKRTSPRNASSFLNCLDDEERFKFLPYVDLMDELPLKSLYHECGDSFGFVDVPVKESCALLDAYVTMKCGDLPTFSDKVKAPLGEKKDFSSIVVFLASKASIWFR